MSKNLVTDGMRDSVRSALEDMHETFSREVTIFKRKTDSFVASSSSTYNALYSRLKGEQKTLGKVTQTKVKARIDYIDRQERSNVSINAQVNVPLPDGSVRLKIDKDGYLILKKSSRVEIDNQLYELISDSAKTGPFEIHYYIMYFKRKD
jgi:predicted ATPase with chaperone activity